MKFGQSSHERLFFELSRGTIKLKYESHDLLFGALKQGLILSAEKLVVRTGERKNVSI